MLGKWGKKGISVTANQSLHVASPGRLRPPDLLPLQIASGAPLERPCARWAVATGLN